MYEWTLISTAAPQGALHARFPQAGHNNSDNFFFVGNDINANNPIIVRELILVGEDDDYWEVFIKYLLAELMFVPRNSHLQISKGEAKYLHAYAGWRVWCNAIGEYDENGVWVEDDAGLEAAWIETQIWYPSLPNWNPPLPHNARRQQLEAVWRRGEVGIHADIDEHNEDDHHHHDH